MAPRQSDAEDAQSKKESASWSLSVSKELTDLLLNRGLYQRVDLTPPVPTRVSNWNDVLPERIHKDCETCAHAGQTTWSRRSSMSDVVGLHTYRCMSCDSNSVTFMLALIVATAKDVVSRVVEGSRFSDRHLLRYSIEKVGQYPAWEAPLSRTLSKALGKEGKSLFIKGASSLRAGRGIGAVAYFRRIIENHIDDILKVVTESATAIGDTAALEKLKQANSNLFASERLKIAAQHTPPHLKPGGHSPLDVMYSAYSEGLHDLSDEASADVANRLLGSITFFFEMWQDYKDRAERFAQTITKTATKSS